MPPAYHAAVNGILLLMAVIPADAQPLATIRSADGFAYQLTPQDELWAARLAVYEGGFEPADALWTVAQRQVYLAEVSGKNLTFSQTVRSFSQPLNPRWGPSGDYCDPASDNYRRALADTDCAPHRLRRRARAQNATWEQLRERDAEAVEVARKWARGLVGNTVPRAMDFAIARRAYAAVERRKGAYVVRDRGKKRLPGGKVKRDNVYIANGPTRRWTKNHVMIESPAGFVAAAGDIVPPEKARALAATESFWETFTGGWFGLG